MRKNLRGDLDAQQLNTFTRWWNSWLIQINVKVKDLCEEIKPGVISIKLLEVLSDSSCGKVRVRPVLLRRRVACGRVICGAAKTYSTYAHTLIPCYTTNERWIRPRKSTVCGGRKEPFPCLPAWPPLGSTPPRIHLDAPPRS